MRFVDELLTGEEKLELNSKTIVDREGNPYTVKQYWQLNLSTLLLNMTRGGFAEFLVLCALDQSGFRCLKQIKDGTEPWDVDGPSIRIYDEERVSRIEVKSTASVQIDSPPDREIELPETKLTFGIPKRSTAVDPIKRRNNDLYVFCHYKAKRKTDNMLDLSFWDFYVYPTYEIEADEKLSKQNTISVWRLHKLGVKPQTFDTLGEEIIRTLKLIEEKYKS